MASRSSDSYECQSAVVAYLTARREGGDDELRKAASKDVEYAYLYARNIDRCGHEDTRRAVVGDPDFALKYAMMVDYKYHPDTYGAVYKYYPLRLQYEKKYGHQIK